MLIKLSSKFGIAEPYCQCWNIKAPVLWAQLGSCNCGEENDLIEWGWTQPDNNGSGWIVVSEDKKQVTFHPFHSSGTAAAKGDTPLLHNYHYYWEVKILTETYGTDIMVGLGSDKMNIVDSQFIYTSLLGKNDESYGLSYTGAIRHNAIVANDSAGFCRGSIVGVRVDMWRGTLEFYLNRKPQGMFPSCCFMPYPIHGTAGRGAVLVRFVGPAIQQAMLPEFYGKLRMEMS